jgi:hypothetical protein
VKIDDGFALLGKMVVRGLDRRTSIVTIAVPMAGPKRLVIGGATGVVGGYEKNRQLRTSSSAVCLPQIID